MTGWWWVVVVRVVVPGVIPVVGRCMQSSSWHRHQHGDFPGFDVGMMPGTATCKHDTVMQGLSTGPGMQKTGSHEQLEAVLSGHQVRT
jgi:hypothetical protein